MALWWGITRVLLRRASTQASLEPAAVVNRANSLLQRWDLEAAKAFLTELKGVRDHLSSQTISPLLSVVRRYRPEGGELLEAWEKQLLSLADLTLVGMYLGQMTGGKLRSFCGRLDTQLRAREVSGTAEGLLSLLTGLARANTKCRFSEPAYTAVFEAVKRGDFDMHQKANLVYLATKSSLSLVPLAQFLTDFHSFFLTNAQDLTSKERAYVVYAYSLFPLECSEAVIAKAIQNIPISTLTTLDFVFILNGLARFPIPGDSSLFKEAENYFLAHKGLPDSKLALTIHAFAKRNQGSEALFQFFQQSFQQADLWPLQSAQIVCSFLRSSYTAQDFRLHLVKRVPALTAQLELPEKLRDALQYWSKLHSS